MANKLEAYKVSNIYYCGEHSKGLIGILVDRHSF